MPSSAALFSSSAGRSPHKNLVEFKAGKMTMKGTLVHPDKRRGLLYVYQSDDFLIHFCWKDRSSGTVEDDLIIFPDDCEFKRVDACKTGRVYVLKFKSSNRKFFFWVQEPKSDKDEENCKKVNEMLNNPPTVGSSRSGGGTPDDLHNLLGSMSQQQLMQLFGSFGAGGSATSQVQSNLSSLLSAMHRPSSSSGSGSLRAATTTASTTASTTSTATSTESIIRPVPANILSTPTSGSRTTPFPGGAIQLSDLQRFLSNINTAGSTTLPPVPEPRVEVDLSEAFLNAESIEGVLADPSLVRELSPHLPDVNPDQPDSDRLHDTLVSPQFQQAVRRFGAALSTGQIGPVVEQFQVGDTAVLAALQGNMEEFVKALENTNLNKEADAQAKEATEEKSKEDDKDKDGDEKMQEG